MSVMDTWEEGIKEVTLHSVHPFLLELKPQYKFSVKVVPCH